MSYVQQLNMFYGMEEEDLPFRIKFSFKKLFAYWEEMSLSSNDAEATRAKNVLNSLDKVKELREPFNNPQLLAEHETEARLLLSVLFPEPLQDNEIKAASMPFLSVFFNATRRFEKIMKVAKEKQLDPRNFDKDQMYINACLFVLNFKYGAGIDFKRPFFLDIPNENGLMRHYRIFFNGDFSDFVTNPSFNPLSESDISELLDNFENIKLWKEKIPPGSFTFEGFALMSLFDVTSEEAISSLKLELLRRDALRNTDTLANIRTHMKTLFGQKDLQVGFAAFDQGKGTLKSMGYSFWNSIILGDEDQAMSKQSFCEFSYSCLFNKRRVLAISDVGQVADDKKPLYQKLRNKKIKSYIAAPLIYDNKLIGILELGSSKAKTLNSIVANKLEDVTPLFTIALQRSQEEHETKLEAIIQEKCTAIHPSVSWRFFEAAENLLVQRHLTGVEEMEEIAFDHVYPLYGQADIMGSSTARNDAIQSDLISQLNMARKVLKKAEKAEKLLIYKELQHRLQAYMERLSSGMHAGDEVSVLDFLRSDIYPVFHHLEQSNPELAQAVRDYEKHLDPDLGVVYKKRYAFDHSVKMINEKIGDYVDKKQVEAQQMFPHYFQKFHTDGVEYNMYIGQSIANNREFNEVYLQNLRLWQLMLSVEVENLMHKIQPNMPMPLSVRSLVLVQSNPMSIRFSKDEKQFDVEGAYNIRYEIVKKRIDKAYIKGTNERLTQAGKLAVVYSQNKEAQEYLSYFDYLQSLGYIQGEVEWLELEDLQGVTGLKALRVEIVFAPERILGDAGEERKVEVIN